jgi:hypothetical protein
MAEKTTFLSRLAGRTLGLVPAVQPMIAPIYAPGRRLAETENALDFSLNDRATGDALPIDPGEQRRGPAIPRQERPQRPVTISIEQTFPSLVLQESQPSMPLQRSERPGVHTASAHSIAIETSMAESSPGTVLESLPVSQTDTTQMKDRALPVGTQSERDADVSLRQITESLESGEADLRRPSSPRQDSTKDITTHSTVPEPRGAITTTGMPPVFPRADIPSVWESARSKMISSQQDSQEVGRRERGYEQELAAPSPTIQVTIGRIEVRATPPTTSRSQQQRTGPHVMSLDEYLNQRARGGH